MPNTITLAKNNSSDSLHLKNRDTREDQKNVNENNVSLVFLENTPIEREE